MCLWGGSCGEGGGILLRGSRCGPSKPAFGSNEHTTFLACPFYETLTEGPAGGEWPCRCWAVWPRAHGDPKQVVYHAIVPSQTAVDVTPLNISTCAMIAHWSNTRPKMCLGVSRSTLSLESCAVCTSLGMPSPLLVPSPFYTRNTRGHRKLSRRCRDCPFPSHHQRGSWNGLRTPRAGCRPGGHGHIL